MQLFIWRNIDYAMPSNRVALVASEIGLLMISQFVTNTTYLFRRVIFMRQAVVVQAIVQASYTALFHAIYVFHDQNNTRKPCCRKETARCRKYSFRLKYANNIPYKNKTSRALKATLQSSKHAGSKHNLTRNQDSKSLRHVFGVSGKAVRQ